MKFKKVLFAVLTFAFVLLTFSGFKSIAADSNTATYTIDSTTSVTYSGTSASDPFTSAYSQTYGTAQRATSGNTMTFTLTVPSGSFYDLTALTLSMHSNQSSGSGYLLVNVNETLVSSIGSEGSGKKFQNADWYGSYTENFVDITPSFTETTVQPGDVVTVLIGVTSGSLYCQSLTLTYNDADITEFVTASITKSSLRVDYDKEVSAVTKDKYTLMTSSDLADNDQIIIIASDYDYAMSSTQNSNNRGVASITKEESNIYLDSNSDVQVLTVATVTDGDNTYYTLSPETDKYLYAASTDNNYLRTNNADTVGDNGNWSISITDSIATITAQGTNTRNTIRFYITSTGSSKNFTCYASDNTASTVHDVSIYKYVGQESVESTSYTFTTVKIRFGGVITTSLYNELVAESATFGIELSTNSDFSSSKTYTMPPAVNGDNYQWAAVVTTPADKYATTIYARAYVVISDTTYYMNATNYSVNSIAQYYVDNAATLGLTDTGMLSALAEA